MIELKEFQTQAAATIATRFVDYYANPVITGTAKDPRPVPFFQALSSITASGKTVILADAVTAIAAALPVAPVVLWLSKGKVVVEQSYTNLLPGGKYHHLLGDMDVAALAEYDADEVATSTRSHVFFATVGTFNQRDKEAGSLSIYKSDVDTTERSTWEALKERLDGESNQRPLLVVYDEAHNLSDQQVDLLMEQEPDAFLLASATMRLPARLQEDVERLRSAGRDPSWLITSIDSRDVADAGLVKSTVELCGYKSPMEETVAQLLGDFRATDKAATRERAQRPKAIYVCQTNIVEGDANRQDDPKQPFQQRQAPPILIWRYLVAQGEDPDEIAVYCTLKVDKKYPPPEGFHLFKGGDRDYADFAAGNFRHIIFNLSLQEGWDDPQAYFAYIDKSMESRVQVEQVIGRLLRQPGATHYRSPRLNTAHFYIRVDKDSVFGEVLTAVERKLRSEAPEIKIVRKTTGKPKPVEFPPSEALEVPGTAIITDDAIPPISRLLADFTDYTHDDGTNTKATGSRAIVRRKVGTTRDQQPVWKTFEQSALVLARWIFTRHIRQRHVGALGVAPTSHPKFDARVGIGSAADHHTRQLASLVVDTYIDNAYLEQMDVDPFVVESSLGNPADIEKYKHSLHAGYDDLNPFEKSFAKALDGEGTPWARNPPRIGYGIPLITPGPTNWFYPDFLVWKDDEVFAIDTKGGHLIAEAVARKLLNIKHPDGTLLKLYVRLVSQGTYDSEATQVTKEGFTVWGVRFDGARKVTHAADLAEVIPIVLTP